MKSYLKKITPEFLKIRVKKVHLLNQKKHLASLPSLDEDRIRSILIDDLNITNGDVVFIHSSLGNLNINISPIQVLTIILDIVGESGTILFPTYPKLTSFEFLRTNQIFDVRKTPTFTGLLNEFARRHPNAIRSFHPTKSVVAIGQEASSLTKEHQNSIYPYSKTSPYYKITELHGKIIGLGVFTTNMSCVHCVDDILRDKFPVNPYHKIIFDSKCIDYDGKSETVKTLAHNMNKMNFNIPKFVKRYIDNSVCEDIVIDGMNFFRADAKSTIVKLVELAENRKTIYKKIYYKFG